MTGEANFEIGELVLIDCGASKYNGVAAPIYEIDEPARYAAVDLPAGTEFRLEGIRRENAFRKRTGTQRPLPAGEPQWFPFEWLRRRNGHVRVV